MVNRLIRAVLVAVLILLAAPATGIYAQEVRTSRVEQLGTFRVDPPEGYSTGQFPVEHRGSLFVDDDKTDGMFFAFEFPGDNSATIGEKMKTSVFERYFPGHPQPQSWTVSTLPAHPGMTNETATLYSFVNAGAEIQLAEYATTSGQVRIHYGYFAMRHTKKARKDAPFLDPAGNGVPKFEKFWRSITLEN
jgi:hypothetical protein